MSLLHLEIERSRHSLAVALRRALPPLLRVASKYGDFLTRDLNEVRCGFVSFSIRFNERLINSCVEIIRRWVGVAWPKLCQQDTDDFFGSAGYR